MKEDIYKALTENTDYLPPLMLEKIIETKYPSHKEFMVLGIIMGKALKQEEIKLSLNCSQDNIVQDIHNLIVDILRNGDSKALYIGDKL